MKGLLPNPWVLLAFLVSLLGFGSWSYDKGVDTGSERVQSAWDRSTNAMLALRAKKAAEARKTERDLQTQADQRRERDAIATAALDSRLRAALAELRQRPQRPTGPRAELPEAPSAGAPAGCTGAGLYAPDAEFLARLADTAQRVRAQRDSCYAAYERGRKALEATSP